MKLSHPNRANKRKQKKGSGCKLCKPWKGRWAPHFKDREKARRQEPLTVDE